MPLPPMVFHLPKKKKIPIPPYLRRYQAIWSPPTLLPQLCSFSSQAKLSSSFFHVHISAVFIGRIFVLICLLSEFLHPGSSQACSAPF